MVETYHIKLLKAIDKKIVEWSLHFLFKRTVLYADI